MSELAQPFPAGYSSEVIDAIVGLLAPLDVETIIDPCSGVGGIHELREHGYKTTGIEIEPEFATAGEIHNIIGDSTTLWLDDNDVVWVEDPSTMLLTAPPRPKSYCLGPQFDACVVSPAYGNRMADQYLPGGEQANKYRRFSYAISLGRKTSERSGASYQFGDDYKQLHRELWDSVSAVIKPDGYFVLNISSFIKNGKEVDVVGWHLRTLGDLGWIPMQSVRVNTKRMRYGANASARSANEWAILLERL